jgi:AcrR family transcriptional regulator
VAAPSARTVICSLTTLSSRGRSLGGTTTGCVDRAAIVEAATALLREGRPPTVAEAAERALVSRATAYRYFPTQESLLLDVANVEAMVKPVEELVASFPTDDPAQRLAALVSTFTQAMLSDEALIRTGVRVYLDTWLANQRDSGHTPVRAGRRMLIAAKDAAGLEDDQEIVATLEWAAGALLRTALHDFERSQ